MTLLKVADFNSEKLGSHFENKIKYLDICRKAWRIPGKNHGILSVVKSENIYCLASGLFDSQYIYITWEEDQVVDPV